MSDFMQLFTSYGFWYIVDGDGGGAVIPVDAPLTQNEMAVFAAGGNRLDPDDKGFQDVADVLLDYYEGMKIDSIELASGWCARYSAPGYMDATSWCGPYATESEAVEECKSVYGDEDEDEDEGEDVGDDVGDEDGDAADDAPHASQPLT